MEDIRWKQRFDNFDRAFLLLRSAIFGKTPDDFSDLEQEGIIQRFEYTYELAWKLMKDYLEENGIAISPVTPREVVKTAFAAGMLEEGQVWIDMIEHRNLLSHSYSEESFRLVLDALFGRYLPAFGLLHEFFLKRSAS